MCVQGPILVTCLAGLSVIAVHALLSIPAGLLHLSSPLGEPRCRTADLSMEACFFLSILLWTVLRSRMRRVCGLRALTQLAMLSSANVAVWVAALFPAVSRLREDGNADAILDVVVLSLGPVLWLMVIVGAHEERSKARAARSKCNRHGTGRGPVG